MEKLTIEQAQKVACANAAARSHLINAITELRLMKKEIYKINPNTGKYLMPFANNGLLSMRELDDEDLNRYLRAMDEKTWKMILSQLGIEEMLNSADQEKLMTAIEHGAFGRLAAQSIMDFMAKMDRREAIGLQHLAQECFRRFSPDYRNLAPIQKIMILYSGFNHELSFSEYRQAKWAVLEKVLLYLDKKALPKRFEDHIYNQMEAIRESGKDDFVCPYFKAKFYPKTQTVRITFERMDLVNMINKIGRNA